MDSTERITKEELLADLLTLAVGNVIKFGETQLEIRKQYSVKTPNKIKVKYLLANHRIPPTDVWVTIDSLHKMIGNCSYSSYRPVYDPKYRPVD